MLVIHFMLVLLALPTEFYGLGAALQPVLIPLALSGVLWFLNRYTGWIAGWSNIAKQIAYVVSGQVLVFLFNHLALDTTSAIAFVTSLANLGLFQLGKATGQLPTDKLHPESAP